MNKTEWIAHQKALHPDYTDYDLCNYLNAKIIPSAMEVSLPYTRDELLSVIPVNELSQIPLELVDYIGKVLEDKTALIAIVLPRLTMLSEQTKQALLAILDRKESKPINISIANQAGFDAVSLEEINND